MDGVGITFPWRRFDQPTVSGLAVARLFDVYGYEFTIESDSPEPARNLASDFEFFAVDRAPAGRPVTVRIREADPDYDALPPLCANVYTPRNASYRDGDVTYADYHGRGLGIHNRRTGDFEIITRSADLQYEASYLFLLAQLGEALDRRHLHRVHALCFSVRDRAALVLLPMGGGKSTLGSNLLADPEVKLLSDDSPFIDRRGGVYGFPTRIGLLPGSEDIVPAEFRRTIQRMEFGPKVLVDFRYFADRVVGVAEPAFVFLGSRCLSRDCEIVAASYRMASAPCSPIASSAWGSSRGSSSSSRRARGRSPGRRRSRGPGFARRNACCRDRR